MGERRERRDREGRDGRRREDLPLGPAEPEVVDPTMELPPVPRGASPVPRGVAPAETQDDWEDDADDDEEWEAQVGSTRRRRRRDRDTDAWTTAWVALLLAALLGGGIWAVIHYLPGAGPRPDVDPVPAEYRAVVEQAGRTCPAIPAALLAAQIEAESGWDAQAKSPAGAQGISQFTPDAWAHYGKDADGDGKADPFDPQDAIPAQARYMCALHARMTRLKAQGYAEGDERAMALAGYNAGPEAVVQARGVPDIAETKAYVARIEKLLPHYQKWLPAPTGAPTTAPAAG